MSDAVHINHRLLPGERVGGQSRPQVQCEAFDRPATIKEGTDSVAFSYGCKGERVSMSGHFAYGILEANYQTDYIGDQYECKWDGTIEPALEILSLGGDPYSAPMFYIKQKNGSWTLYNIGRDYLGSITQIATTDGTSFFIHVLILRTLNSMPCFMASIYSGKSPFRFMLTRL